MDCMRDGEYFAVGVRPSHRLASLTLADCFESADISPSLQGANLLTLMLAIQDERFLEWKHLTHATGDQSQPAIVNHWQVVRKRQSNLSQARTKAKGRTSDYRTKQQVTYRIAFSQPFSLFPAEIK